MTITYTSLVAYINSLKSADGTPSKMDLNNIIKFIVNGGLNNTINIQKSSDGGNF